MNRIVNRIPYIQKSLTAAFPDETITAMPSADTEIYISSAGEMDQETLNAMAKLKLCILESDGYDSLDLSYFAARKICLVHAHDIYSLPIAEYIVAKILDHTTKAPFYRTCQETHTYVRTTRKLLSAYTIGFLGTGSIARAAVRLLKPFAPTVIGYKRTVIRHLDGFDALYYKDQFYDFLARTDILVAALDLNPSTRTILDQKAFQAMKTGSALINIARGAILDEIALCNALESGKLSAAYLDVFCHEPLARNHPLWTQPHAFLTPHASAVCQENTAAIADYVIHTIRSYMEHKPIAHQVLTHQ